MRYALIVVYFSPSNTSAAIQMGDLARELRMLGHNVLVITPSQKIKKNWELDEHNGIEILRLRSLPVKGISYFKRAVNESLMPMFMIYWYLRSSKNMQRLDGVIWYSPTIFFGLFALFLKFKYKCKGYLILRDIFPEWAKDLGLIKNKLIYKYFKAMANLQYWVADTIGVQAISNIVYLKNWGNKKRKIEVLNNWLAQKPVLANSINIKSTLLSGKKVFAYIGTMGVAQNLEIFIELAEKMQGRKDIGFLFLGGGERVDYLKKMARSKKLNNTIFYKEIHSDKVPAVLSQCAAGLIALDPRHKTHNIPGKFLAYLSAGLPIFARINPNTDLECIIKEKSVGFVHTGSDLDVMSKYAQQLLDDLILYSQMKKNALKLYRDQYSPRKAANQIIASLSLNALEK